MAVSDPVADMLTKMRNAILAKHEKVDVTLSNMHREIVKIMKVEGFIRNFKEVENDKGQTVIRVYLKYTDKEESVIHGLKRISTPGRRIYSGYKEMPRIYNGYGVLVVSTSSGITTGKKAAEKQIGGELLCSIW